MLVIILVCFFANEKFSVEKTFERRFCKFALQDRTMMSL